MKILGKGGLLYNLLAITIYISMPIIIIIMLPIMFIYEKVTGKDF